jgi:two-component system, NtrC family, sensor kinase
MRITYKLTLLHILAITAVLAVHGWLAVRREVAVIEEDKERDTRAYGACLTELVREVWTDHGDARALELLSRVDSATALVTVRWRWVDAGDPRAAQLREGRAAVQVEHDADGGGRLTTLVPVIQEPRRIGAVWLEESLQDESDYIHDTVRRVVLTTVVAVVLLGALAALVGSRVVGQPMQELVALARRVGQGDLSRRLALHQRDEVGELGAEMNLMCDRLVETREELQRETAARIEAIERLRQNDRLATVGRIAAGVAHELGTPLNVVQGHADLIAAGELSSEERAGSARAIGQVAQRMARTIGQMLDFARRRPAEKEPHDLTALAGRALGLLDELARRHKVAVRVQGPPVTVEVDAAQLEQVVTNLAMNAIHAMPEGGAIEVTVAEERRAPPGGGPAADVATVVVTDQGTGIAPEHVPVLFEPFFTTKPVGQGTGLGLPIAQGIVQEHGGWIEVESRVGRGSTFRVCLPRRAAAP